MIFKKFYIITSKLYSVFFTLIEDIFLKKTKINFGKPLVKFKSISKTEINYEYFEKIIQNKYLTKFIFPEDQILKIIKELFIKNNLSNKITEMTGYNYSISFFTAYETKKISEQDLNNEWYANEFHKDKPFSQNMVKIFFSYHEIGENNGPMFIKSDQIYKATILKDEVILFSPNKFYHKASSPKDGKRFQMMFQLNPSKKWNLNKNIFKKQKKIEPKFPFFSYLFDKKIELKKLFLDH